MIVEKREHCSLGTTTSTSYNSIFTQNCEICPKRKIKEEKSVILGSPIDELAV